VVAGNDGEAGGAIEGRQPGGGAAEFLRQCDIHQIAGQRDVIGLASLDVGHDAGQRLGHMEMHAVAPPVEVARGALVEELPGAGRRHGQMRIGQMRQGEHGPSPG
jgi:hypothetical protein